MARDGEFWDLFQTVYSVDNFTIPIQSIGITGFRLWRTPCINFGQHVFSVRNREILQMIRTPFGLALASLLLISGTAFADQFSFLSPGSVTWNGVYVNPYLAKDNTQPQNNPLTIYCDDWNTDFSGTPTWNADVYTLTAANATYFKYGKTTPNYNVTLLANNQLSAALSAT